MRVQALVGPWLLGAALGGALPLAAQQPSSREQPAGAPRSWIGVLVDLQITATTRVGESSFRIVVDQVSEGGPAHVGGLRPGDRILSVEGAAVTYDRWMRFVPSLGPGDPLRLTVVRRDGSTESVTVVAQARPPSNLSRMVQEIAVARTRFQRSVDSLLVQVEIELRDGRRLAQGLRFRIGPPPTADGDSLRILARAVEAQIATAEGPGRAQSTAPVLRRTSGGRRTPGILTPQVVGEAYVLGGAQARTVTGRLAAYFQVDQGVLITDVLRGSPAAQVGFLPGDVIVSVGGLTAATVPDLRSALGALSIPFAVEVIRQGTNLVLRFPGQ